MPNSDFSGDDKSFNVRGQRRVHVQIRKESPHFDVYPFIARRGFPSLSVLG